MTMEERRRVSEWSREAVAWLLADWERYRVRWSPGTVELVAFGVLWRDDTVQLTAEFEVNKTRVGASAAESIHVVLAGSRKMQNVARTILDSAATRIDEEVAK